MSHYTPIKVVIADDHELILDGLQGMLKKQVGIDVIGAASNGEQLLNITRQLSPDVVITDIKMPKLSGVQATQIIKDQFPHIGVIALSSYDEANLIIDMLKAGAKGFLLKTAPKSEVVEAIQKVYKDESYYCANTKEKLAEIIARTNYHPVKGSAKELFTERELQVIKLICEGLSSKQIADKLGLRTRTIESYREKIMEKMDVNNTAAVVMYAANNGLTNKT